MQWYDFRGDFRGSDLNIAFIQNHTFIKLITITDRLIYVRINTTKGYCKKY